MNNSIKYFERTTQIVKYWNNLIEKKEFINIKRSENIIYIEDNNDIEVLVDYFKVVDNEYVIAQDDNNSIFERSKVYFK